MQLWFSRGSEVTIREQLVTQVILGILSDDLAPGQRLADGAAKEPLAQRGMDDPDPDEQEDGLQPRWIAQK